MAAGTLRSLFEGGRGLALRDPPVAHPGSVPPCGVSRIARYCPAKSLEILLRELELGLSLPESVFRASGDLSERLTVHKFTRARFVWVGSQQ